jgi:hypothetical protein
MLPLLYVAVVALSGGVVVGFAMGRLYERERAALRRPAAHEALARVYQMPNPAEILAELRGPLLPSRPNPTIPERRP